MRLADDAARSRRGENAVAADQYAAEAIRGSHAQDDLDGAVVEKSSIATEHERLACIPLERREDALHEIFQVTRLLKDGNFLAQSGGARTLSRERLGGDGGHDADSDGLDVEVRLPVD